MSVRQHWFRGNAIRGIAGAIALSCGIAAGGIGSDAWAASAFGAPGVSPIESPALLETIGYRGKQQGADDDALALFEEGQYELDSGYPDAAVRIFKALVSKFPDTVQALEAQKYLARLYAPKAGAKPSAARPGLSVAVPQPEEHQTSVKIAHTSPVEPPPTSPSVQFERDSKLQFRLLHAVGDRVFFAPNSSELGAKARQALRRQAVWLSRHDGALLEVAGHADEPGSISDNLRLSKERAEAVRRRLIEEGIDGARIRVVAVGQADRITVCGSARCSAQNRRVVTRLLRRKVVRSDVRRSAMSRGSRQ